LQRKRQASGNVEENSHAMMDDAIKKKVLIRLRKIAGQVRGIARMIEEDRYCAAAKPKQKIDELMQVFSRYGCMGAR
jgi:hypothetical protein